MPSTLKFVFLELVHDLAGHLNQAKCIEPGGTAGRPICIYSLGVVLNVRHFIGVSPEAGSVEPNTFWISGAPEEKLAIDLQGPFPASNGYRYILSVICCLIQ